MDLQEVEALIAQAVGDADLRPDEIPAIDLYLDQITSLFSEKLKEGSPLFRDRVLTKTMVNNYSKDGLISPVHGKKYNKEHIVQMLLVYSLKNTLSISEIKRMLHGIYNLPNFEEGMLEDIYLHFLEIKEFEREEIGNTVHSFLEGSRLDPKNESDFFTFLLGLAAMSSYLKNTVQVLLEAHYPDPDVESEREERERRDEEKRRRTELKAEVRAKKAEVKAVKRKEKQNADEVTDGGAESVSEQADSAFRGASDET